MTRSLPSIHYGPMSLERHQSVQVAALLYESAPELFKLLFGDRAISILTMLVERSHNRFSHQYIYVAELNNEVVGVATLVPAENLSEQQDVETVLTFWQRVWIVLVQHFILNAVLQHDYPAQTIYIGNLAVQAKHRGQGIGTQLLQQCLQNATQAGASSVFISVDIDNPRAKSLYESLGFCPVMTKSLRLPGRAIGSIVLEKRLKL